MAILNSHPGSWYGLPDFGVTEAVSNLFGQGRTSQGGSNLTGAANKTTLVPTSGGGFTQATQPIQIKKSSTATGGGSGGQVLGASAYPETNIVSPNQSFGGGSPSESDVINNEFNAFNSYLDQQAGTANQNFNDTKGLYDTTLANNTQQLQTDKTQQTEGIAKNEALNLSKVRQLLADLSQKNAARTSITGGGSVSEALGERFGRQANSSLGNVMDQSQQAIERVNTFYNNSIQKLQDTYNSNIIQAKQTLQDNLSNIQSAKIQSASAKQQNQLNAWKDYYNSVNKAKTDAANFKAQYDLWKQQQDSAYSATAGFNLSNQDTLNKGLAQTSITSPGATNPTGNTAMNPYYSGLFSNSIEDKNKDSYNTAIA